MSNGNRMLIPCVDSIELKCKDYGGFTGAFAMKEVNGMGMRCQLMLKTTKR